MSGGGAPRPVLITYQLVDRPVARPQANLEIFFIKVEQGLRQDHVDKFSTTVEPNIFSETLQMFMDGDGCSSSERRSTFFCVMHERSMAAICKDFTNLLTFIKPRR